MRKFLRMWALMAVLLGTAAAASAATPSEFYLGLLRRGTASYEANRHTDAVKQLRIAAFGLVEAVDQYQIAQVYLTLTYDKLSDPDRAREAAHRVVVAERIERKYAALPLPVGVRTAFEAAAGKLLSSTESAMLLRGVNGSVPTTTLQHGAAAPAQTRRTTTAQQTKPSTSQPKQTRNTIPPPQTSTSEKIAPQSATPTPQSEKPRTVTFPQTTKPSPVATTQQRSAASTPTKVDGEAGGRGGPVEPARPATAVPATAVPARTLSASEVAARLAAGDKGLNAGKLNDAQRAYRDLLGAPGLDHATLIRIAEGLYRARDFSGTLSAFNRVGTLRAGEEPYRYYIAVALYEIGDIARAKKELAAVLPHIEVTPDVARYRIKIEGAK
jgi:hypothetical protein